MTSMDSSRGRRATRYAVAGVVIGLLAMYGMALAGPARVSAASATYNGGVDITEAPSVMLNDHTVYAVRFQASGLETSTPYYVKVRISPVRTGQGQERNRGFTWNRTTGQWVHERDAWTGFPQVTTDPDGTIPLSMAGDANWLYTKFSDETTTGTYYIVVSLSKTGVSSTLNASVVQTVTVTNAATQGAWVHNVVTAGSAGKRIDATVGASVYSMSRTETNTVDDDNDGIVDNENWGNGPQLTSFRLPVPLATSFTVRTQKTAWGPGTGKQVLVADTDIALGATDQVAPTAPGTPIAVASSGKTTVSWTAASDDQGVYGYNVYRWNDPSPIDGLLGVYTSAPVKIGTVTGGATTFEDLSAPWGKTSYYQIRAVDAASNVGPRSAVANATPVAVFMPVYRFYNFKKGVHFYTASETEKQNVINSLSGTFRFEGQAYAINTADQANSVPLFRFYNFKKGVHFYTASETEKQNAINTLGGTLRFEGVAFYLAP